jgi:hypothetical protein
LLYRITKNELNHFHENLRILKMLKKTLLAVTLAALSTSAMAIDVTANAAAAQDYSHEGIVSGQTKNDGTELTLGADGNANVVALELGAEYTTGDTVTLTLSGAKFKKTETFTLEQLSGAGTISLGFLSATDTTLTFRVTGVTGVTDGIVLLLDNGTFEAGTPTEAVANSIILDSSAIKAKASITASALTGTGLAIDVQGTAKDTFVIADVIQEHKFIVDTEDSMSGVIDVAKARKEFKIADDAEFIVNYDNSPVDQGNFPVTATGLKYTVNGSMAGFTNSIVASSNDGTITAAAGGALTVAADLQSASVAGLGLAAADDTIRFAVDPTAADRVVLNVSDYTVDAEIANIGGNKVTYTGIAAGSHTLNGSNATFAYVPVNFSGAVTTQFEIGNKGTVDGEITVSGFDTAGTNYSAVLPFTAEAGKLTKVSDADISTAFGLTAGTKLNLTFTVNAPALDITYGAYSNRGTTGRMSINKI